jgi:methylthioribulose-1-phosphate dehydratase
MTASDATGPALADALVDAVRFLFDRGWSPGTGGNFSVVASQDPLRLLITPSGADKGTVTAADLITIDSAADVVCGTGKPSAESLLHVAIVRKTGAASVLHTHSIWNTVLSRRHAAQGELVISGLEMLKGLAGVRTHEHCEAVPILPNSQDMVALSEQIEHILTHSPACHGILLAGHGLYTWGASVAEARRHVEIFEFLFEVVAHEPFNDARRGG